MNTNPEENFLNIYDKLFETGKLLYGGSESLSQKCINIESMSKEKWNIMIGAENNQHLSENEFKEEFELIKSKLLRKTTKCVFFGKISSGKSTLINGLLARNILPEDNGSTTNCFVEITASPTNENYLVINNERKKIEELKELTDIKLTNHLENGSLITMYYDKNECELLKDDVVIIDTPGIDSTFININSIQEYLKDADVFVLVVNAIIGITTSDEQFFKEFRTRYTKLNLIIVFNFWDIVNRIDGNISLEEQFYTNAKNILCNMLQLTDAEAHSSIFFISASERIKILTKDTTPNFGSPQNERNESFNSFLDHLQSKISTKNYTYLIHLLSIMTSSINQCQNCVSQMKDKKSTLVTEIEVELLSMEDEHKQIPQKLYEIFNNSFDKLLIQSLELRKDELDLWNKICFKIKNLLNDSSSSDCKDYTEKFCELFKNITSENLQKLKYLENNLKDILKVDEKNISPFRQNILNEIYFPFYYNLNNKLNSIDIEKLNHYLNEIISTIIIGKGILYSLFFVAAIGLVASITIPCALAGGAAAGGATAIGGEAALAALVGSEAALAAAAGGAVAGGAAASSAIAGGAAASSAVTAGAIGSGAAAVSLAACIVMSCTATGGTVPDGATTGGTAVSSVDALAAAAGLLACIVRGYAAVAWVSKSGEAAILSSVIPTANSSAAPIKLLRDKKEKVSQFITGRKLFQLPFRFSWIKEEIAIRKLWYSSEINEKNNYGMGLKNVILSITELIASIEERSKEIQNNLNNITEELRKLRLN